MTTLTLAAQEMRALKAALRFTVLAMEAYPTEYATEAVDALNATLLKVLAQERADAPPSAPSRKSAVASGKSRACGKFTVLDGRTAAPDGPTELEEIAAAAALEDESEMET